ncbi:MAG: tRNA uridine-5-carboxymethylaminomethyl(34) synthesis enzyme MnmG, partial [candidate division Zixibacteria bacterium]|nr:tRNA uridine-5-carboxymethylaminomethyl(34) synthesis enzyme MnmG [candidate division Zixibacteria bacterium]
MENSFDIIVIGGGHAGCEAAHISAKMAQRAVLLTGSAEALSRMSCNPSVGGLAKAQLVKEIDALGGIMGQVADISGVQFRLLNRSKGPAVRSTRVQCDRSIYEKTTTKHLSSIPEIKIAETFANEIVVDGSKVMGVKCEDGTVYWAKSVIVTTGTFLNGLIHIGMKSTPAGRFGEKSAVGLTESLNKLGIRSGRLKTGTPPRLDGKSIDFTQGIEQPGDEPPPLFSYRSRIEINKQLPCFLTYTNDRTHQSIHNGLDESPLFTGIIRGVGPRYCPSIEDKVVRFPDRIRHQLFLEPEGWDTDEIYINGFSSSLPVDVQLEALRTISGLENVKMNRPGYAIEYDYFPSSQIMPTMESKLIENLYFAGQVNGTSGYEE